jgi:enhancer of polycomb-like protein
VRHSKYSPAERKQDLEYVVDAEDEVWLLNNSKFGGAARADSAVASHNQEQPETHRKLPQLTLDMLEHMIDILEKATGFETIVTTDEGERRILERIPALIYIFPSKARAGVVTVRHVIQDVYNYWVQKRSKLKRPLLRRFWPVTASDDTNPHLVFRPREKEKYKLRKKRQNDMDAFRKMKQLRHDFEKVLTLIELVKKREELNRCVLRAQEELFEQQMYDLVDTSGLPRVSETLQRDAIDQLMETPRYFDAMGFNMTARKRRRTDDSATSSTTSAVIGMEIDDMGKHTGALKSAAHHVPVNIAGYNHGEPAPNFLHPLKTRESFVSSWDNAVPFIASYENSHPTPTFRFRHRPRVGRGGRICIDRLPQPLHPDIPSITFFTAGQPLPPSLQPKDRLLDLFPTPLDHESLSRKIEELCVAAIREDYEAALNPALVGVDPEENDGEIVLVKVKEWLETDDQPWGDERYAIGPL